MRSVVADVFQLLGNAIENKYRVDTVIGEGGFGVVYQGWHLSFERAIAIKCLKVPQHFTQEAQQQFFESFRKEGKLLDALCARHPSIVRVYDFGVTQGRAGTAVPYLILEWLEGQDLEHLLADRARRGEPPYTEREAIQLLRPAVEAIATAHRMAPPIAHRDIKPSNLFLVRTRNGGATVKVLDFGIAKAMQKGETATQVATRTTRGFSAFSPPYAAAEQFQPGKAGFGTTGPWTDVHALGLILVELVTGRAALDGHNAYDNFESATNQTRPTPRARGADVSDAFDAMCAKAIALLPKDRHADASELLEVMDLVVSETPEVSLEVAGVRGATVCQPPTSQAVVPPSTQLAVLGIPPEQPRLVPPTRPASMGPETELADSVITFTPVTEAAAPLQAATDTLPRPSKSKARHIAVAFTIAGVSIVVGIVAITSPIETETTPVANRSAEPLSNASASPDAPPGETASSEPEATPPPQPPPEPKPNPEPKPEPKPGLKPEPTPPQPDYWQPQPGPSYGQPQPGPGPDYGQPNLPGPGPGYYGQPQLEPGPGPDYGQPNLQPGPAPTTGSPNPAQTPTPTEPTRDALGVNAFARITGSSISR